MGESGPRPEEGGRCMSDNPLTPAQRSARARIAAHTRWANEPDRLAATAPGRNAAFQKLLDEVDPEHILTEDERLKRAHNAQKAHLERVRLAASRARVAASRAKHHDGVGMTATPNPAISQVDRDALDDRGLADVLEHQPEEPLLSHDERWAT